MARLGIKMRGGHRLCSRQVHMHCGITETLRQAPRRGVNGEESGLRAAPARQRQGAAPGAVRCKCAARAWAVRNVDRPGQASGLGGHSGQLHVRAPAVLQGPVGTVAIGGDAVAGAGGGGQLRLAGQRLLQSGRDGGGRQLHVGVAAAGGVQGEGRGEGQRGGRWVCWSGVLLAATAGAGRRRPLALLAAGQGRGGRGRGRGAACTARCRSRCASTAASQPRLTPVPPQPSLLTRTRPAGCRCLR